MQNYDIQGGFLMSQNAELGAETTGLNSPSAGETGQGGSAAVTTSGEIF